MKKEQLREVLTKGKQLAGEYEELNRQYNRVKRPILLSGALLVIILIMLEIIVVSIKKIMPMTLILKDLFITNPGQWPMLIGINVIIVLILLFFPIIRQVTNMYVYFIGKCFLINKQKGLKKEISHTLDQFIHSTQLPQLFCETKIIDKFIGYLDIYQADSLKECVKLYKEEERHEQILEGIGDLKKEISAVGDKVSDVSERI
ncbi:MULTISPECIES: hypothetical protein [Bacillus]|uniref:hypothetical protein n=1 Tax=Bacillus TaxID=1386 RepID=UPI003D656289